MLLLLLLLLFVYLFVHHSPLFSDLQLKSHVLDTRVPLLVKGSSSRVPCAGIQTQGIRVEGNWEDFIW